jgi:hypothetical protein
MSLRGKLLAAVGVVVPEFDTYLLCFSARLAVSNNIRWNLMSVKCMNLLNSTRKISLNISVESSICEEKKNVNFQSKCIMKTCRTDDDVISDTALQVEAVVVFRLLQFLSTNCVTGAGERGVLSVNYNVFLYGTNEGCQQALLPRISQNELQKADGN